MRFLIFRTTVLEKTQFRVLTTLLIPLAVSSLFALLFQVEELRKRIITEPLLRFWLTVMLMEVLSVFVTVFSLELFPRTVVHLFFTAVLTTFISTSLTVILSYPFQRKTLH